MSKEVFGGPLFIVGLSRSGTKLLRDILNKNPNIGIPIAESHFLPFAANEFCSTSFETRNSTKEELLRVIFSSPFYGRLSEHGFELSETSPIITSANNFPELIESLMRYFADTGNKREDFIWGDKTPNNLLHMKLLQSSFPSAKFIHIVRDPRARALSVKKAWGGNVYFSAHRWNLAISYARAQVKDLGNRYLEISYEELVSDPQKTLHGICEHIGVRFDMSMLTLDNPVENRGDKKSTTRHTNKKVPHHMDMYKQELSKAEIGRIEEIAYPMAKKLGYINEFSDRVYIPLLRIERLRCICLDIWNTFFGHIRYRGFLETVKVLRWRTKFELKSQ